MKKCPGFQSGLFVKQQFVFTLLIACMLSLNNCLAQSGLFISLEPNLLLANRKITTMDNAPGYLSSKNALGLGVNIGYQKTVGKKLYITGTAQIMNLRNLIVVDFAGSGFDSINKTNYGKQRYSISYLTIFGVSSSIGYQLKVTPGTYFKMGIGGHINGGIVKPGAGAIVTSTKYMGFANAIPVYKEELTTSGSNVILIGFDLTAHYTFQFDRRFIFVGLHYALNPGKKIRGSYTIFPYSTISNTGTFEISKDYVGIDLGVSLGRKTSR